jgi:hypothetical protein
MTLEAIVCPIGLLTTTLATKTWSFRVIQRSICNETPNVKAYHRFLHTKNPFYQMKAYMTSQMASCGAICWPPNGQWDKCLPNASNPFPHSHVKKLNDEGWIKPKWKHNVEMKVECVMWNE